MKSNRNTSPAPPRQIESTVSRAPRRDNLVTEKAENLDLFGKVKMAEDGAFEWLSTMTNHRGTGKGAVRGGFDREAFVKTCEEVFDRHTGYRRRQEESFAYCHALRKGSVEAIRQQAKVKVAQEVQYKEQHAKLADKLKLQPEQKQKKQPKRKQTRGIRQ